jgi:hypothetical protein
MPGEDRYPSWLFPVAIAFGTPFYIAFLYFGNNLRAFLAALFSGTMFVVVATLWNLRKFVAFWLVAILAISLHAVVLFSIRGTDSHFPGVIFTPVMVVDVLLWQFLTVRAINLLRI